MASDIRRKFGPPMRLPAVWGVGESPANAETSTLIPRTKKVVLVTKLIISGQGNAVTSPISSTSQQIDLRDGSDTTQGSFVFYNLVRATGLGQGVEQALVSKPLVWEPQHPIVVPENWRLAQITNTTSGTTNMAFGYEVDAHEARAMGFDCSNSSTDADRRIFAISSALASPNTETVIAGRTGKSIRIWDLVCRLQPNATAAANCSISLQDSAGNTVFRFANDNPVESYEAVLRPRIYLPSGRGIQINVSSGAEDRGSLTGIIEFVDDADVPDNAWFVYKEPPFVSPGSTGWLFGNRIASIVKAAPSRGLRHVVEGYHVKANNNGSPTPTQILMGLTTGSAAGPLPISNAADGTNPLLSPLIGIGSHDMEYGLVVDQVELACPGGTAGNIFFEAMSVGSPSEATGHVDAWNCTVWGRTEEDYGKGVSDIRYRGANT